LEEAQFGTETQEPDEIVEMKVKEALTIIDHR